MNKDDLNIIDYLKEIVRQLVSMNERLDYLGDIRNELEEIKDEYMGR